MLPVALPYYLLTFLNSTLHLPETPKKPLVRRKGPKLPSTGDAPLLQYPSGSFASSVLIAAGVLGKRVQ